MGENLEGRFNTAMWNLYQRARDDLKCSANRFRIMLTEHGALRTTQILIHSHTVSEGYIKLWKLGRLDLSVEALVHDQPEWQALFTKEELEIIRKRLCDYGYGPAL
jgi:hypothetical protein